MEIKTKLRFSKCVMVDKNEKTYCYATFLDDDDNKYTFFISREFYNELMKHKKYDLIDLNLKCYESNKNGRFALYLNI